MNNFKEISSNQNKIFKIWKDLLDSKGVKKHKKALIQGKLIVHEYFKNFYNEDIEILFTSEHGIPANLGPKTKSYLLEKSLFSELNITGVNYPMLCVPIPEIKNFQDLQEKKTQVYLPLGDPKNIGAAIRNCLAFGVNSIILLKEAANPFHPLAIKASSGACFYIDLFSGPEINNLQIEKLYILDSSGEASHNVKWPEKLHLLVGEEGQGHPEKLINNSKKIAIPISDKIESLNANQALGIALYESFVKRSDNR